MEPGERQQRPLVVVGRDQPPAVPGQQFEIVFCSVYVASSFGVTGQCITDLAAPDPLGGVHRPYLLHQGGQLTARGFGHP